MGGPNTLIRYTGLTTTRPRLVFLRQKGEGIDCIAIMACSSVARGLSARTFSRDLWASQTNKTGMTHLQSAQRAGWKPALSCDAVGLADASPLHGAMAARTSRANFAPSNWPAPALSNPRRTITTPLAGTMNTHCPRLPSIA